MEGLTGESCFPALAFSLKGGSVLCEPSRLPLRILTQAKGSKHTSSLLYKVKERFYWETALFSLGVLTRGEVFSTNLLFPLSRPLTQANSSQLTSSLLQGKGGFHWRTILVQPWYSHSRGRCSLRTYLSRSRDF